MAVVGTIQPWMVGTGTGSVILTVLSVNGITGVLDDASPGVNDLANLTGILDGLEFAPHRLTENISPINYVSANHYPVMSGHTLILSEILGQGHSGTSPVFSRCFLANAFFAGRSAYVKAQIQRPVTGFGPRVFTVLGIMLSYDETLVRGKNVGQLSIGSIDAGVSPVILA